MNKPFLYCFSILLVLDLYTFGENRNPPISDFPGKIDTAVYAVGKITGTQANDTVVCHITAENWQAPMTIEYTIIGQKARKFKEIWTNKAFDDEFGTSDMDDGCTESYLTCKQRFYLQVLPQRVIKKIPRSSDTFHTMFDSTSDYSIQSIFYNYYLDSLHMNEADARAALKKITQKLEKQDLTLVEIPVVPKYPSFPRLFDPLSEKFIMILY